MKMDNAKTFAGLLACMDLDALSADIAIIGIPDGTMNRSFRTANLAHFERLVF
jgi:hypothetical protein